MTEDESFNGIGFKGHNNLIKIHLRCFHLMKWPTNTTLRVLSNFKWFVLFISIYILLIGSPRGISRTKLSLPSKPGPTGTWNKIHSIDQESLNPNIKIRKWGKLRKKNSDIVLARHVISHRLYFHLNMKKGDSEFIFEQVLIVPSAHILWIAFSQIWDFQHIKTW